MMQRPDLFQLERNHPLAKGLVFAGLGSNPGGMTMLDASVHKNNGSLAKMDPPTDWVFVPELGRWGLDFSHNTDYITVPNSPSLQFGTGSFSVVMWMKMTLDEASTDTYMMSNTTGTITGWRCYVRESGAVGYLRCNRAAGGYVSPADPTNVCDNLWHHAGWIFHAGGTVDFYVDGLLDGTQTTGSASVTNAENTLVNKSYGVGTAGSVADELLFNRALTPNEIADLADPSNVYLSGLIAGRPRRRYVFLGGGSTVEINATLASLNLTGNAAGVSVGTNMTTAAGAVELSGLAASVSSGTDIAATTASIESTGLDAAVSVGADIAAGVGNLGATAQAASVSVGTTFTATAGAMTSSGLSAVVSTGDSIEATVGAVELSGLACSVSAGTTFTGETGVVSLSGLAADVSVGTTITGSLATLFTAALTADVSATVSIEASTAAMGWSSPSVSVSTGGRIKRPHMLHGGRLSHDWGIKTGGAL